MKFNPIVARMLGRRIGKFFNSLFKYINIDTLKKMSADISGDIIIAVGQFINTIASINVRQIKRLSKAFSKIDPTAGMKFVQFMRPILQLVSGVNDTIYKNSIKGIGILQYVLSFLSPIKVIAFIATAALLSPLIALRFVKFFRILILGLGSMRMRRGAKNAKRTAQAISILIMSLTVSLILLVSLAAITDPKNLLIGIGILTLLIGFAIGISMILSLRTLKKSLKGAIFTSVAFAALLLSLSMALIITTAIATEFKLTDIMKGLGILLILLVFTVGVVFALSSTKIQSSTKKSIFTVLGFGLLLLILAGVLGIVIAETKGREKAAAVGTAILLALLVGTMGIVYLASKMSEESLLKGLLAIGGISVAIGLLSGAMVVFGVFLKGIHDVTAGDITAAFITAGLVVAGVAAIMASSGAILMGPQALVFAAGLAGLAMISTAIAGISTAMILFTEFITKVNNLTSEDIEQAFSNITGEKGLCKAITKIVGALGSVSIQTSRQMKAIGKGLKPVFESLSMFVDVIQKMATMSIIDHFDDNGNPVYRKMEFSEFSDAADNLGTGFASFLTKLFDALSNENAPSPKQMKAILKALKRGGVSNLMVGVGSFVDAIQKMAELKVVDHYDDNGNPVYRPMEFSEFDTAATNLATGFARFLTELMSCFDTEENGDKPTPKQLKKILKALTKKGDVGALMMAIGSFVDAIQMMASGQVVDYYDNEGKAHYRKMKDTDWTLAAETLTSCFSVFIQKLASMEDLIDDIDIDDISDIVEGIQSTIVKFFDEIIKKDYEGNGLTNHINNMITSFESLITFLNTNFINEQKSVTLFAKTMQTMGDSLKKISDAFDKFKKPLDKFNNVTDITAKQIGKVVKALKDFDKQLINENNKRLEAIKNLSDKFSDMNTQLEMFNNQLQNSIRLTNEYKEKNSSNKFTDTLQSGAEKVVGAIGDTVKKIKGKEDADKGIKRVSIDSKELADALKYALTDILGSRAVEFQFGTSEAKKLQGIIKEDIK